jgi:hypothetical protein
MFDITREIGNFPSSERQPSWGMVRVRAGEQESLECWVKKRPRESKRLWVSRIRLRMSFRGWPSGRLTHGGGEIVPERRGNIAERTTSKFEARTDWVGGEVWQKEDERVERGGWRVISVGKKPCTHYWTAMLAITLLEQCHYHSLGGARRCSILKYTKSIITVMNTLFIIPGLVELSLI